MRYLDRGVVYPDVDELRASPAGRGSWTPRSSPMSCGLRCARSMRTRTMRSMGDALENVLEAMSPAEAFNFGSALNQIGKSASRLASDPAFIQVVRTAAPIAGGAVGTAIGGPLGTAVGSQLGTSRGERPACQGRTAAGGRAACRRAACCRACAGYGGAPTGVPHSHRISRPHRASRPRRRPRRSLHACLRAQRRCPRSQRFRPHRHRRRRWRGARRPRRRLWCFASSAMCCRACWRRLLASTAASRSAAFPPRR